MTRILFVCLGNICRSPTAEAVMNALLAERGLTDEISCDSAGTSGYHVGDPADARMRQHAQRRGVHLTSISRQLRESDLVDFDYVIGMDASNLRQIHALDVENRYAEKIHLMTDYCRSEAVDEVPDPYYGGASGFERVLDILEDACGGVLATIEGDSA